MQSLNVPEKPSEVKNRVQPDGLQHTLRCSSHVQAVAFSPDGSLLAVGETLNLRLWNTKTWQLVRTLETEEDVPRALAFSPDGQYLAVELAYSHRIQIWNCDTWRVERVLRGHKQEILSLSFSPDSSLLAGACSSVEDTLRVWQVATGKVAYALPKVSAGVYWPTSVAFSPDGARLAAVAGKRIVIVDTATWQVAHQITETTLYFESLAYSPDGKILGASTGHPDGSSNLIRLYETSGWRELRTLRGHEGVIDQVTFSPKTVSNANLLASTSDDGTMRLWNTQTGIQTHTFGRRQNWWFGAVAFSPDANLVVAGLVENFPGRNDSSGQNNSVTIWRISDG